VTLSTACSAASYSLLYYCQWEVQIHTSSYAAFFALTSGAVRSPNLSAWSHARRLKVMTWLKVDASAWVNFHFVLKWPLRDFNYHQRKTFIKLLVPHLLCDRVILHRSFATTCQTFMRIFCRSFAGSRPRLSAVNLTRAVHRQTRFLKNRITKEGSLDRRRRSWRKTASNRHLFMTTAISFLSGLAAGYGYMSDSFTRKIRSLWRRSMEVEFFFVE